MSQITTSTEDRRKKRAGVLRLALAGVAVLGIGAAATSAAWTDDAWFSANANAVTVELQGSTDGGDTYVDADDATVALQIPDTAFQDLNAGDTKTFTVHLKNNGSVPLTVSGVAAETVTTGGLFASGGATVAVAAPTATSLAAGATTTAVVSVSLPADAPASFQGTTGTLTVVYRGQS